MGRITTPGGKLRPHRYKPAGIANWSHHLPFAYDLICSLKPHLLVELGTHYGESYFGFCQAVAENRLPTQCYAVDTWLGDGHAGFYDETVYQDVAAYNNTHYRSFSYLLRMTFDEASGQFSDGTIDLLHIDGLHTYATVAHDFSTWFPKVKPGGVILLHDIAVRSADFGVWRLWEELSEQFDTFGFQHGSGLGVLRVPGPPLSDDWLMQSLFGHDADHGELRQYYVLLAEAIEGRMAASMSTPITKDHVYLKVYTPTEAGYTEDTSVAISIPPTSWQRVTLDLPRRPGHGRIRIDPAECPATVAIREIRLRTADGRVLWEANSETGFVSIDVNHEVRVLSQSPVLRCASFGPDPQLFLPVIPTASGDERLSVESCLQVDVEIAHLIDAIAAAQSEALKRLQTERDLLGRELEQLQQQIDAGSELYRQSSDELAGVRSQQQMQRQQISALEASLQEVRTELSRQSEVQHRNDLLIQAVADSAENRQLAHDRLRLQISQHATDIHTLHARVDAIMNSRIWRTLVRLGGTILRFQRRRAVVAVTSHPVLPNPSPSQAETSREDPSQPSPVFLRVSASRDTKANMGVLEWKDLLSSIAPLKPQQELKPRITIITPTWNTLLAWFAEAAISVLKQSSTAWEWCVVDDGSTQTDFQELFPLLERTGKVQICKLERNRGISAATNEGLNMARGEYVCFLDHDDLIAPTGISECLELLGEGLDAVYTDSDKVNEAGIRSEPFYKPDWSPEYFRGVMYVGHLLCVRRDLALEIGGFDSRYDGVQDFDFMLRYSERTKRIGHLSTILYHWRASAGSVAGRTDAKGNLGRLQKAAVQAHLDRLSLPAIAESGSAPHRVQIAPLPRTTQPMVSVIVPTKDAPDLLERCVSSILSKTTYAQFEILCVDNETTDGRALELLTSLPVKRIPFPGKFNFSRANNFGVQQALGEYLVFLNNDVEVITRDWIEQMLYYAEQPDVGAVGALLVYPDGTVQHAGVVLGCRGTADHVLRHAPADSDGYAGSLSCAREVSAVTAACLMIQRDRFAAAGGFNEHYFTAYQDVDLCLQLRSLGFRNIFTPRARLLHLESRTRGQYYDFIDRNLLLDRWEEVIQASDPYYNRNFDVERCAYTAAVA